MTLKYIDLHTHSIYSDGLDDPKSLVRNVKLKGIEVLALTDHDTIAGYDEANIEANKWGITLIPGVEVSTEIFHILGLNFDKDNQEFNDFLLRTQDIQKKLSEKRIEMLHKAGFPITIEMVISDFPKSRLGKYNLFMSLIKNNESYTKIEGLWPNENLHERFQKLFGKNGLVEKVEYEERTTSKQAIDKIHSAGGIAIVAHPFKQVKDPSSLDHLINEGIDGLEIQPNYSKANIPFEKYAINNDLLITYGSDYHGSAFSRPLLGRGENRIDIEELSSRGRQLCLTF